MPCGLVCGRRRDAEDLGGATFTVLAELIDNVFSHSETALDGYAALQVYPKGDSLQVAVSDSVSEHPAHRSLDRTVVKDVRY
jgi:hypothetical protein